MRILPIFVAGALISTSRSQTPPDTFPKTNELLSVSYGSTKVTPGITLPVPLLQSIPTFSFSPGSTFKTYHLLLIDLTISINLVNQSALVHGIQTPLAPGLPVGRTTRLHFWQPGITFSPNDNGTLTNTSLPIAYYQPPRPPPGDIPHTYVYYLFEQSKDFTPPSPDRSPFSVARVNDDGDMNRMSFDVGKFAKDPGTGTLLAATYFEAQNKTASSVATGSVAAVPSGTGGATTTTTTAATSPIPSFTGGANYRSLGVKGLGAMLLASLCSLVWLL